MLNVLYCCCYTDISLFDELDNLGDADELLEALQNSGYVSNSSFEYANSNLSSESLIGNVCNRNCEKQEICLLTVVQSWR